MSATLEDLRGALADAADTVVAPSPDATRSTVHRRHRATATRRRRSGVAALTLVAVAAAGGALGSRGPEHRSAPVLPAVRTVTDGSFATYQDGLRLVQVDEVPVTDALVLTPLALPRPAAGGVWAEVQLPRATRPGPTVRGRTPSPSRPATGSEAGRPCWRAHRGARPRRSTLPPRSSKPATSAGRCRSPSRRAPRHRAR